MSKKYVPLTLGSVRSQSIDVGAFSITDARFPPMSTLPPHRHERTVFAVILQGSFEGQFGAGKRFDCGPKTILTEPAGEQHGNRFESRGARVLVIQPDPEQDELFRPCSQILDGINHFQHPGIASKAWRLVRELNDPDGASRLAVEGLGLEILATAVRTRAGHRTARPPWLTRVEELLRDRFLDDLGVDEVAATVGIHPMHLARVFRTYHRESIGLYLRKLRLDWASIQLATTQDPIVRIALQAGFADQSHFTRAFKRYTGFTPGYYRKALDA
jgi:AraC family transcriptional regulator